LRRNKHKNEADEFLNRGKGLRAMPPRMPLSAAPNARRSIKSLYLPKGIPGFAEIALQAFENFRE
jgi:hypothetical protein